MLGEGYEGFIDSLKWFNLASSPLATFADNTETTTVTIDATGKATLPVNSRGTMLSFGSRLPMQSIAIYTGDTRQTIELLSTATFEALASVTLSGGLVAGAPEFDLTALDAAAPAYAQSALASLVQSDAVFPKAHAYDVDFMDIMSIAGSLIGLDSLQVIWDQMGNMIAGQDMDVVAFSVAILDVLSLFPPAAPLKLVVEPAQWAIKVLRLGNVKAVQYLGGGLKTMFAKAKDRDFSLVYQGIAFFIIMADMYRDEEAREGIAEIAKMINSTDDFLDLLDYFSIADDEITLPETTAMQSEYGLFPQAHAGVASGVGALIGKAMKELAPEIARMGKDAPKALGEFGRGIKKANKAYLKSVAFKGGFIRGCFAYARNVGISNIRKLLASKHRVGPITLIATIAYLEKELDDRGNGLFSGLSTYDREHNERALRGLYITAIPAVAAGGRDYKNFVSRAHGAQFQLLQIAILHGMNRGGNANAKVVGIEVPREISIFAEPDDLRIANDSNTYSPGVAVEFGRSIDIITGALGGGEIWREMKSYKARSKTDRGLSGGITAWKWGSGKKEDDANDQEVKGNTPHRQYILDRVAQKTFARMRKSERDAKGVNTSAVNIRLNNLFWHFHEFETKSSISPDITKVANAFNKEPAAKPSPAAFYNQHIASHKSETFVMGSIDLFLTETRSNLADAVRAEVEERVRDVVEEVAL